MRRLIWPPKAEDPEHIVSRAWVLGWEALNAYAVGDNAQTRRLHATQQAYEKIGIEEPVPGASDGSTRWSLGPEGGAMLLEEAEWLLLKSAIEDIRKRRDQAGNPVLMGTHSEPLLWLDELLTNPPEVPKEALTSPES